MGVNLGPRIVPLFGHSFVFIKLFSFSHADYFIVFSHYTGFWVVQMLFFFFSFSL